MKILGVDYGTKRIGLAISDETEVLAFPRGVLPNDAKIFEALAGIIHTEGIGEIVLGDPGDNEIADEIKIFAKQLSEQFGLEVAMEKEFMTSMHVSQAAGKKPVARKTKKEKTEKRDDSAAALILQRFLERK